MTTLTISDSLVASMAKAIREWDGCSNKDCVKGCKAFSEQDPEYVCGRQTHDYLNAIMPAFQAQMDSALLSERESATKAERERCAERFEKAATLQGRQECCGFPTSAHECCADPLYMISDRDGARAIRNGSDFVPAAAIRKGDGE